MNDPRVGLALGGYRIEAVLGRGGMGVVYRAEQLSLGRRVALKVIAPELASDAGFRERFERESRIAASIDHPNVVPVYEAGEDDGVLFITMRLVPGTDLRSAFEHEGRLDPSRAARIIAQVGGALDAAHARGLVHRDVKPANILVARESGVEHAYLMDFGLTKHAASRGGLTGTGQWVGTVDYVAPEQIEGPTSDGRADVYALGGVLYEALVGEVPYPADSDMRKMWAHVNNEPPQLDGAPPGVAGHFGSVIARAMAKSPEDRYPSAGDLGRAAEAAAARQTVTAPERSVATGIAAPAAATVPADRPARRVESNHADGERTRVLGSERRGSSALVVGVLVGALLLALGLTGGVLLSGANPFSDDDAEPSATTSREGGSDAGDERAGTDGIGSDNSGSSATADVDDPADELDLRSHSITASDGSGYAAEVPVGWSEEPSQQGTERYSTEFVSPDGEQSLVIDYTPQQAPDPLPPPFEQLETIDLNGQLVPRYATTEDCDLPACVVYQLPFEGRGVAVLARGPEMESTDELALAVAQTVEPQP